MRRQMQPYEKDCMKMVMLKQEETFKQQVRELHRLYRVQKLLMNDMKERLKINASNKATTFNTSNSKNEKSSHQTLNLKLSAEEYIIRDKEERYQIQEIKEEEEKEDSDLDLTLAIGSKIRKNKKKYITSDSGSSSTTDNGNDFRLFQVPNVDTVDYQKKNENFGYNVEEQMSDQRPPWLFKCLSLNMT